MEIQEVISKTKDKVILVVKDNKDYLDPIEQILFEQGYKNILTASSGSQTLQIIDERKPDLVILDIMLPDMDGYDLCSALLDNEETSDIPVIMLTDKISQKDLKKGNEAGVFDYIKKPFDEVELIARVQSAFKIKQSSDNLIFENSDELLRGRIGELKKENEQLKREIDERNQAEVDLWETEERYSTIVEGCNDGIAILRGMELAFVNQKLADMGGYTIDELYGSKFTKFIAPKDLQKTLDTYIRRMAGKEVPLIIEIEIIHKDGHFIPVEISGDWIDYHGKKALVVFIRDITERKRAEGEIQKSEERYSTLVELSPDGILMLQNMKPVFANQRITEISGYDRTDIETLNFMELIPKDQRKMLIQRYIDRMGGKNIPSTYQLKIKKKSGKTIWVEACGNRIEYNGKPTDLLFIRDITDRKKIREELRESEERYSTVAEEGTDGIIILKGLKVMFANKSLSELIGLTVEEVERLFKRPVGIYKFIDPKHLGLGLDRYRRRMAGEEVPQTLEMEIVHKDGHIIPVELSSTKIEYKGGPADLILIRDISERKQAEAKLKETLKELERSNKELEQFAYVASHDLQEPLRMVSSYLQLISRRYKGKLDSDADEFIHYAVDGATRMQAMIQSLLTYSRVGTSGKHFEPVDCEVVLDQALNNLSVIIEEKNVLVTHDPIPTVMADDIQLVQLLQNLIGNGIKYNDRDSPKIHVSCEQKEGEWVFSVADNGIGIDPKYKDEIFRIFSRLHGKEYSGTGIGLAVCKKIVERHGGRVWVKSELGVGSTFYFTIPSGGGDKK